MSTKPTSPLIPITLAVGVLVAACGGSNGDARVDIPTASIASGEDPADLIETTSPSVSTVPVTPAVQTDAAATASTTTVRSSTARPRVPPSSAPPSTTAALPTTTIPTATTAATSTVPPDRNGVPLAVVDVGARSSGADGSAPLDALAESGMSIFPIPAGDAVAVAYGASYETDVFSDAAAHTARETITYSFVTAASIEEIDDAFVDAIRNSYEIGFSATRTASAERTSTTLTPDESRRRVPRYDITITASGSGIEVEIAAGEYRAAPLPEFTTSISDPLDDAASVGADLGWSLLEWSATWGPGISDGELGFSIGPGSADDVASWSDRLARLLPASTDVVVAGARVMLTISDSESWEIRRNAFEPSSVLSATYRFES